jgi:hypothetical protein
VWYHSTTRISLNLPTSRFGALVWYHSTTSISLNLPASRFGALVWCGRVC